MRLPEINNAWRSLIVDKGKVIVCQACQNWADQPASPP